MECTSTCASLHYFRHQEVSISIACKNKIILIMSYDVKLNENKWNTLKYEQIDNFRGLGLP